MCKYSKFLLLSMLLHTATVNASSQPQPQPQASSDQLSCGAYENVFAGMNFSPFPGDQHPGRDPHVDKDIVIRRIEQIHRCTEHIRTFTVRHGADITADIAAEYDLHITPGAWLSRNHRDNIEAIDTLVATVKRHPKNIDAVIIGSENLLRNELSAAQIISYLQYARAQLADSSISIGYADSHDMLKMHPEIIAAVDNVYVNIYPYWEGYSIEDSIAALDRSYRSLLLIAGDKPVIISETGWPSCGEVLGKAIPSPENSARYLQAFLLWAKQNNVNYFYFSAFDASWKSEDEGPQGACWGILSEQRLMKPQVDEVLRLH
jgi:exo-beta-1,3-glucanase (GH17 family)